MVATFFDWLPVAVEVATLLSIFVFAPLGIWRRTRPFAGWALVVASYVLGAILWIYGAALTFSYWGWVGLVVGLLVFGVGVVPMGLLATALHSEWAWFFQLSVLLVSVFTIRLLGAWMLERVQKAGSDEWAELQSKWKE